MEEIPLSGGRITEGVVRVEDTVRRPARPNSPYVRRLFVHLQEHGFSEAPTFMGTDEQGREILSYIPGVVPPELDRDISDGVLEAAARLIRRFHDATAGSEIAATCEVVCHGDLSPCNFVHRDGEPVALIDFDTAAPGARLDDLGYALFLWLNLGADGKSAAEQERRIGGFCRAYGVEPDAGVVDAIVAAVASNIESMRSQKRAGVEWWEAQLIWLKQQRADLVADLDE